MFEILIFHVPDSSAFFIATPSAELVSRMCHRGLSTDPAAAAFACGRALGVDAGEKSPS